MVKKKSYNPFKMWGSWLGLVLGLIIQFKVWGEETIMCFTTPCDNPIFLMSRFKIFAPSFASQYNNLVLLDYLLFAIMGFLLGWGIHSLIRRMRK